MLRTMCIQKVRFALIIINIHITCLQYYYNSLMFFIVIQFCATVSCTIQQCSIFIRKSAHIVAHN